MLHTRCSGFQIRDFERASSQAMTLQLPVLLKLSIANHYYFTKSKQRSVRRRGKVRKISLALLISTHELTKLSLSDQISLPILPAAAAATTIPNLGNSKLGEPSSIQIESSFIGKKLVSLSL